MLPAQAGPVAPGPIAALCDHTTKLLSVKASNIQTRALPGPPIAPNPGSYSTGAGNTLVSRFAFARSVARKPAYLHSGNAPSLLYVDSMLKILHYTYAQVETVHVTLR